MTNLHAAQGTELAIVAQLADFYYTDPIAYNTQDLKALGTKFHRDLVTKIDPLLCFRICTYVAAVFADICNHSGAGDLVVIRGELTNASGHTLWHHWNYDQKSGLYIDTMLANPLVFRHLPERYKITTAGLSSEQVLGIELSSLKLCAPVEIGPNN